MRTPLVKRHTLEDLALSAAEAQNRYHKKVKELSQTLLEELRRNMHKYNGSRERSVRAARWQTDELLSYEKSLCQEFSAEWERHYWYGRTGGQSDDDFIPARRPTEGEPESSGDFRGDDVNFELMANDRPRVTINTEKRFILTRKMLATFEEYASRYKMVPVELLVKKSRQAQAGAKARRKTMDDFISVQFGMAMVNLSYLLYPGVGRLRGAYRIQSLDPARYEEQTGGRRSLFLQLTAGSAMEDTGSIVNGKKSEVDRAEKREIKEEKPKKSREDGKDGDKAKDKEKHSAGLPMSLASNLNIHLMPELPARAENDVFSCGKMYLVLDIRMRTPLVKRHTLEDLALSVQSLIPHRDDVTREARSAAEAQNRYHKKVKELSQTLLEELRRNMHKYTAPESGGEESRSLQHCVFTLMLAGG
ncbi:cilia- and flagella-associated protein 70-like [Pollicipes pollicipes]|uniref:cilia- and flagella-associated protein 70-like n=1 Tax=Pollicipes pollicipes TaxID=41117 RepID=UPI0018851637|nr:cilia- and flagella-associated protein 70-like [Pollicipes pollicipes]